MVLDELEDVLLFIILSLILAFVAFGDEEVFTKAKKKATNGWKLLADKKSESDFPPCLYTHITGVVVTIGGMPVDLGLPGDIDLKAIENAGLLD